MSGGESGPNNAQESMASVRGPLTLSERDSRDCHGKRFFFFFFCPGIFVEISLCGLYFSSQIFVEICVGCFAFPNVFIFYFFVLYIFFVASFSFLEKKLSPFECFLVICIRFCFLFKHIFYFKQFLEIVSELIMSNTYSKRFNFSLPPTYFLP